MKSMRQIGGIALLTIVCSLGLYGIDKAGADESKKKSNEIPTEIEWLRYDEALAVSKAENKHIFVDFTATWCGWCKRMDRDTFSKAEVIEMLNSSFVPAKVWQDKGLTLDIDGYKISEQDLGRSHFGVTSFPTFWFVAPDGVKIGPIRGYVQAEQLMKALDWVKDYKYDTTRVNSSGDSENSDK